MVKEQEILTSWFSLVRYVLLVSCPFTRSPVIFGGSVEIIKSLLKKKETYQVLNHFKKYKNDETHRSDYT